MALLKDISVISLLVVCTSGISGWYVQKSLQINQFIENTNNEVKLNSAAAATLKTESVSREFVEIIVKDLTSKVVEAKQEAVQATVQAAQIQGATQALAPMLANPALSETLKTLAESPQAIVALTQVAEAVEEANTAGTDNSALELVTRIDSVESNIKKLEDLDVPGLILKLEELSKNTPSLTALDEAIKKTTDELTARGDKLIADEVAKLSSKLSSEIINTTQPVNVRIGNAENSILTLNTKVDGHTTSINNLTIADIGFTNTILGLQAFNTTQTALNSTLALSSDLVATNALIATAQADITSLGTRVSTLESNYFSPTFGHIVFSGTPANIADGAFTLGPGRYLVMGNIRFNNSGFNATTRVRYQKNGVNIEGALATFEACCSDTKTVPMFFYTEGPGNYTIELESIDNVYGGSLLYFRID